jgi:hypothetical protein
MDEDAYLQTVTPAFEDWRLMVRNPYAPGQYRWFKSPNIKDLMSRRRDLGMAEWNDRDPAARPAHLAPRSANVVVLASWRRRCPTHPFAA